MLPLWLLRCAIVAVACTAAMADFRRRVVPNGLTLPALALGLAAFAPRGQGLARNAFQPWPNRAGA